MEWPSDKKLRIHEMSRLEVKRKEDHSKAFKDLPIGPEAHIHSIIKS